MPMQWLRLTLLVVVSSSVAPVSMSPADASECQRRLPGGLQTTQVSGLIAFGYNVRVRGRRRRSSWWTRRVLQRPREL